MKRLIRILTAGSWLLLSGNSWAADAEPRFDLAVVNAPARSFFVTLVHDTPYNLVVAPDVGGTISLDLKHVTVGEVLEMTRELYGYDYEKLAGGWLVLPASFQTRMFYVNYLDLERSGTSRTRITSGQLTQSGNSFATPRMAAAVGRPMRPRTWPVRSASPAAAVTRAAARRPAPPSIHVPRSTSGRSSRPRCTS